MPSQQTILLKKENNENDRLRFNGRRRKYRPSPIKIHSNFHEETETKLNENKNSKISTSPTTTTSININKIDTPTKSIHVPFKPLHPRGIMSPKVSHFIRRNNSCNNNNRTPTSCSSSILASPSSVHSPIASPGSDFGFAKLDILNSPSLANSSNKMLSLRHNDLHTPSKPSSLSNIIVVDDIIFASEEEEEQEIVMKNKIEVKRVEDTKVIAKTLYRQKVQKEVNLFLDKLISITPTRQTLNSERGDFNILRQHLHTNRRYVLIGNKNK